MVLVPLGVVRLLRRAGRVADAHIVRREQRLVPLAAAVVSVAVGLALLHLAGAPAALVRVLAATLAALLVLALVTVVHKVSFHTGVVAGGAVALWVTGTHLCGVVLGLLVPVVAWARVRRGRHSVAQVVLGGLVAAAVAAATWWDTA